jgi:hypothetical protein
MSDGARREQRRSNKIGNRLKSVRINDVEDREIHGYNDRDERQPRDDQVHKFYGHAQLQS